MVIEHTEIIGLDETNFISFSGLVELSGLSRQELQDLVECGALTPVNPFDQEWTFKGSYFNSLRAASRICEDFGLDFQALALTLKLFERIRELEDQLRELKAQLPRQAY